MLGRLPVHPVAVAVAPVLLLWVTNVEDVAPPRTVVALAAAAAVGVVLTLLAWPLTGDLRRGALVAAAASLVATGHGHLWGTGASATVPGVPIAIAAVVAAWWFARRSEDSAVTTATRAANVLALAAVVGMTVAIAATVPPATDVVAAPAVGEPPGPLRDILWIVPDRFGGATGLEARFGIDNQAFEEELRDRGFAVPDDARANYPRTAQSLAAQLNLSYIDDATGPVAEAAGADTTVMTPLLLDHATGRLLRGAGYEYVHLGNWWDPTRSATAATEIRGIDRRSEFATNVERLSLLPALGLSTTAAPTGPRENHRAVAAYQLDQLDALARELVTDTTDAPRLVFAHLALPHPPFVFDADGSAVTEEVAVARGRAESFDRQLTYLEERLLDIVDLATAPDDDGPIILIQADEGPHARGYLADVRGWTWADSSDDDLVGKFSILSAVRIPGRSDVAASLPPGVTGVNVARLAVGAALGIELDPLPDRSFVSDRDSLYTYTDVTERLDRLLAGR